MKSWTRAWVGILLVVVVACSGGEPSSPDETQPAEVYTPDVKEASSEGENAIRRYRKPPDLQVELIAAEPYLANVVSFDVSPKGDIYVAESFRILKGVTDIRQHPDWLVDDISNRTVEERLETMRRVLGRDFESYRGEHDRVKLIQDTDGDGVMDRHTVFADGFKDYLSGIGSGVLCDGDDVYYTCIPDLWKLRDTDGDGVADQRTQMSTGYGVRFGFYGHDLHGLIMGPDGKLYFSIGDRGFRVDTQEGGVLDYPDEGVVFRCNPDGSELEVVHRGLRNPQELAFDEHGNLFTGDNNSDGGDLARWVYVAEGGDSGWRIGYQHMEEPVSRGPWNAERLWLPQFDGQAAYILPPIANLGAGPAGLAYYPGTGLPDAYQRHFFLADFRGDTSSLIHSFTLEPRGASFELTGRSDFLVGSLVTDVEFGPRPGIYFSDWVEGWGLTGKGRIYRAYAPLLDTIHASQQTADLLGQSFDKSPESELTTLLHHADQRIRQKAQFALVKRGISSTTPLKKVALQSGSLVARLHAIWGLGQLGRQQAEVAETLILLMDDLDAEVRSQAAKVASDLRLAEAVPTLIRRLKDSSDRVRSFAALGLGKIGSEQAFQPILEMVRSKGIDDPYIRHSAVMGLAGTSPAGELARLASDPSLPVRLTALVALRKLEDPSVGNFLDDSDLRVRVEAARAIYDTPIAEALPNLAGLIKDEQLKRQVRNVRVADSEMEALYDLDVLANDGGAIRFLLPLYLRVIGANWRLGHDDGARSLADVAADGALPRMIRVEAMRRLGEWSESQVLDPVVGLYRPSQAHDPTVARGAIEVVYVGMLQSRTPELLQATIRTVAQLRISAAVPALARLVEARNQHQDTRAAALEAVARLGGETAERTVEKSLRSDNPQVRSVALVQLARLKPEQAVARVSETLQRGATVEKQAVIGLLGQMSTPETNQLLSQLMDQLNSDQLEPALRLDVLLAAQSSESDEVDQKLATFEEASGELGLARAALQGGNSQRGAAVFFRNPAAQCQRCHSYNRRGGAEVGPDLSRIGERLDRQQILDAILFPNRSIAEGYEMVEVFLTDGRDFAGRLLREDDTTLVLEEDVSYLDFSPETTGHGGESAGQLPTPQYREVEVEKDKIRVRRSAASAMPEDLAQRLTPLELRDLVEFLATSGSRP